MSTPTTAGRSAGGAPFWEPPSPEELSAALPAYEVEVMLGRGGMGAVYRAVQRSLKRTVAIKVLPPTADDELKFAERFRHEAETLARLNHPGIVHIHDFGETVDGLLYLVMEFVDGTDVHQLIQANGRLSEDYALAVTAHVCDALAYAHSRGIVHRDIKPANVLIDQEGNVKVADFGLAKMVDPTFDSGLTMSNVALGTPDFVAPEVLSMGMTVDHRADLYAVGVMLYQMLTGEVPRGLFKLPSQRGFVSDERWDEIICRAMEADRDERYQSAVEVRYALDAIMTGVVAAEPEAVPKVPARTATGASRSRAFAVGGIVLAAIATAFTTLFLANRPPKIENPPPALVAEEPTSAADIPAAAVAIDWLNGPPIEAAPWAPAWNLRGGVVTVAEDDLKRQFGRIKDGAIRIRLGLTPDHGYTGRTGPQMQLDLRSGAAAGKPGRTGNYQFQVYLPNRVCALHYQEKDPEARTSGPVETLWSSKALPVGEIPEAEVEWVFQVDGDRITATADGVEVCSVRDARVAEGYAMLTVDRGTRITRLETTGLTPVESSGRKSESAEAIPPRTISNWQDVTETLREKAQSIPQLVVEPDHVRHVGEGETPTVLLTKDGFRDYAVRIRFTGDGQVNLRANSNGFIYVLCQRTQMIFQRYHKREEAPTVLIPSVRHPAGYDSTSPHELLVTMEGPTIRAWLDGRFVGEANDDTFNEGSGGIAFTKFSVVWKVEIAELANPAHPKLDRNFWGQNFWGQVKEVNAERQVEIVEGALESINKNELTIKPTIEGGKVTALTITQESGEPLHDLSPVSALTDLKTFFCYAPGVRDLEWLRGMAIDHLQLENAWVEDFRPLRESKITHLDLDFPKGTPGDYSLLAGLPLRSLSLQKCPLKDLTFLSGMPLNRLVLTGTGITDYSPLKALPLAEVELDLVPERDLPILLSIPTLKKINGKPVEDYRGDLTVAAEREVWTDWLGEKLADPNRFNGDGWFREDGGVTTDQALKGIAVLPEGTRDGAVRIRFAMRDSEGVQITTRERSDALGRHLYLAHYTGENFLIAYVPADAEHSFRLFDQPLPGPLRARSEHTLEFRFIGDQFDLVLDGELHASARHSVLKEGRCAVVLTKGVLVKSIETLELPQRAGPPPALSSPNRGGGAPAP